MPSSKRAFPTLYPASLMAARLADCAVGERNARGMPASQRMGTSAVWAGFSP